MDLPGFYAGTVEDNKDPEHLGRLKVRVPHVFGAAGTVFGAISTDSLPWALPAGMPAGGSALSGGFSMLPAIGDQVLTAFLDGEPEKPVWMWFMQTRDQSQKLKLHEYLAQVPDRAILTRYGHSLEITPTAVTLTTQEGYQLLLKSSESDTGGTVQLLTPKGQIISLNDVSNAAVVQGLDKAVISSMRVMLSAPTSTLINTGRFTLMVGTTLIAIQPDIITVTTATGATLAIDDEGNVALSSAQGAALSLENTKVQLGEPTGSGVVVESGKISINGQQIVLNTASMQIGTGPVLYPVFLLTPDALAYFLSHTHTNGNQGAPTGPPIPLGATFPVNSGSESTRAS